MMSWTALRRLNWRGLTVCAVAFRLNIEGLRCGVLPRGHALIRKENIARESIRLDSGATLIRLVPLTEGAAEGLGVCLAGHLTREFRKIHTRGTNTSARRAALPFQWIVFGPEWRTDMAAKGVQRHPKRQRVWLRVLLPIALVVIGAPFIELWSWNSLKNEFADLGYVLGLGSLVVFTFYGIWSYERTVQGEPGAKAMRDAIAASVVLMYLVLVAWAVFFASGGPSNTITSQLLTSFTSITGVVVAFYFTSVTVDQVTRTRRRREPVNAPTQDVQPGKDAPSEDQP